MPDTPLHLRPCLNCFPFGSSGIHPISHCKSCGGTGWQFPMLGRECTNIRAAWVLGLSGKQTHQEPEDWSKKMVLCRDCNGTGRLANYTTEALLDAAMEFTGSAMVEIWYNNYEDEDEGGVYWVVRLAANMAWTGRGSSRLAALKAALVAALEKA